MSPVSAPRFPSTGVPTRRPRFAEQNGNPGRPPVCTRTHTLRNPFRKTPRPDGRPNRLFYPRRERPRQESRFTRQPGFLCGGNAAASGRPERSKRIAIMVTKRQRHPAHNHHFEKNESQKELIFFHNAAHGSRSTGTGRG